MCFLLHARAAGGHVYLRWRCGYFIFRDGVLATADVPSVVSVQRLKQVGCRHGLWGQGDICYAAA